MQDLATENTIGSMIPGMITGIILYTGNAFQIDIYLLQNLKIFPHRAERMKE